MSRPVPTRIYLTGMPGSGKSAVGRDLAGRLGYLFVDLDEEVERLAGRPVASLFEEGEAAFRAYERRALEVAAATRGAVVATGGGTLIDSEAREIAMRSGVVIYLRTTVETLVGRLSGNADRPLLLDEDGAALAPESLRRRLLDTLSTREVAYGRADIIVDAGDVSPEAIAESIATRLGA